MEQYSIKPDNETLIINEGVSHRKLPSAFFFMTDSKRPITPINLLKVQTYLHMVISQHAKLK